MNSGGIDYKKMWAQANGKALFDQWYAAGYPEGTPPAAKGGENVEATSAAGAPITWTNTMKAVFAPYVQLHAAGDRRFDSPRSRPFLDRVKPVCVVCVENAERRREPSIAQRRNRAVQQ